MKVLTRGFCPFRVESQELFQAGCALRLGQKSLCYTQDVRPLLHRETDPDRYYCPLLRFNLDSDLYTEIEKVLAPLLLVQDEENTAVNIWPMLKGWADSKEKARSIHGQKLVNISIHVRETLEEIVCDLG